jgi:hypothetical protein
MPDEKLVDLPSAAFLDGTELLYSVQTGIDVKVTTSNLLPTGSNGELQYNSLGALGSVTGSSWDGTNLTVPNSLVVGSSAVVAPGAQAQLRLVQTGSTGAPSIVMTGNFTNVAGLGNKSVMGADTNIVWFAQAQSGGVNWTAAASNPLHLEIPNGYLGLGVAAVTYTHISGPSSGVLAVMNGATHQAVHVYNTADVGFTTPINYERGVFDWTVTTNVLTIGSQAGGGGTTVRDVRIVKGTNTFFTTETSTVGGLPIAGIVGRRHFVTDASTNTFATVVASGGTNKVPVYDDGTNWRIG